jgi:hypothetical protein
MEPLDIDDLLRMSSSELLQRLGEYDGTLFASPSDGRARGARILRNAIDQKRKDICNADFIKRLNSNTRVQVKLQAVAAVLDFLGTSGAATAATLIVQVGIDYICSGDWENKLF